MIQYLLIIGLSLTGFISCTDLQDKEYQWIESCYGIECIDPNPDDVYHWNYRTNI